jgi:RNA ligase (TIGR02306 family)
MENNNSVCFAEEILKIEEIAGADNILLATCKGWTSVIKKDQFKVGDYVICITTDAVVPVELATTFGITNYLRHRKSESLYCVRTIKLKGVYSECLLLPVSYLNKPSKIKLGDNLSEELGIYKYEPPERIITDSQGKKHKYHQNPNFHKYTKFPNHKNVPDIFVENEQVIVSEKIHGTNARYGIVRKAKITLWDKIKKFFGNKWVEYEYVYGSHNVEKGSDSQGFYSTDIWKEIADKYNIKSKLWNYVKIMYHGPESIGNGFIIYGEIFGPGIQGEAYSYGLKEKDIRIFDIKISDEYLEYDIVSDIVYDFDLLMPIWSYSYWSYNTIFENYVKDTFIHNTKVPQEGIVVRSLNNSKIAKIINPDYYIYAEKHNVPDSH